MREEWFIDNGYSFTSIWECEFAQMLKDDQELKEMKTTLTEFEPLNPRDAFFGGRTEHFRTFWEAAPDEYMAYVDFTSISVR